MGISLCNNLFVPFSLAYWWTANVYFVRIGFVIFGICHYCIPLDTASNVPLHGWACAFIIVRLSKIVHTMRLEMGFWDWGVSFAPIMDMQLLVAWMPRNGLASNGLTNKCKANNRHNKAYCWFSAYLSITSISMLSYSSTWNSFQIMSAQRRSLTTPVQANKHGYSRARV